MTWTNGIFTLKFFIHFFLNDQRNEILLFYLFFVEKFDEKKRVKKVNLTVFDFKNIKKT